MKYLIQLFVVLFAGLLLVGCGDEGPDIDIESSIPVKVESVKYKPIKEFAFATGTLVAANDAMLKSQQSGFYQLQKNPRNGQPFAMGDSVKLGETIIILKNPEVDNQVSIDSKKLNYDVSKREFEKQQNLYEKGGITLRELTDAERIFIDSRYSLENAKLQLEKLKVIAPFDGILVDLPYFSKNQSVDVNSLLARLMDYSSLVTEVTLPGKEMARISRKQEALITNYNKSSDTLIGHVTQVSPALDPDSRMFKLTMEIDNQKLLFRPGMFVKVDIVVDAKDSTLVIPKNIILQRRGGKTIFVVDKGIAVERVLETGLENRDEVEVLSGLEAEERLVVEGFETLRHRSKVRVSK